MSIEISEDLLVKTLKNESVLLNLKNGDYFSLNEVAAEAFEALKNTGSIEAATKAVVGRFDETEERVRLEVEAFVRELIRRGLAVEKP